MSNDLLAINDLEVSVAGKSVIRDFSLVIERAQTIVIMGANGSGKSSLAMTLMGDARYNVTANQQTNKPTVNFDGKDLLAMTVDARAREGLFLAWQNPVMIPGVSVFNLCKTSYEIHGNKIAKLTEFKKKLEDLALRVGLTKEHVSRSVNEGFSGGEKKRLELLLLLLLKPKLAILDEVDSGLDNSGVECLTEIISEMKKVGTSFILITHNKSLLGSVVADKVWGMKNGQLQARV